MIFQLPGSQCEALVKIQRQDTNNDNINCSERNLCLQHASPQYLFRVLGCKLISCDRLLTRDSLRAAINRNTSHFGSSLGSSTVRFELGSLRTDPEHKFSQISRLDDSDVVRSFQPFVNLDVN
jgi:hypothetical protein